MDPLEGGTYVSRIVASGRVGSHALPGFWVEASWFWREEPPSTITCLREILGSL